MFQPKFAFRISHLFLLPILLLMAMGIRASAATVTLPAGTLIDVGDTTYDGDDIIVSGGTVTINGSHSFASLLVQNGGVVTTAPQPNGGSGLTLSITGNVTVDLGGSINANGCGWGSDKGPGKGGSDQSGGTGGGGASYGGEGTPSTAASGVVYGDLRVPTDLGSGGGSGYAGVYAGGAGGGIIKLMVSGTLQVNGRLQVDGNGANGAGAGSGGSLLLNVGTLSGSGNITAYGGYGNRPNCCNASGGGGGGGRIAIYYSVNNFTGGLLAAGNGSVDYGRAAAGTIYLKNPSQTQGDLWIGNDNQSSTTNTPLNGIYVFDNIRVFGNASLVPPYQETLDITVLNNCTIEVSSAISANGRGYPSSQGPGKGKINTGGSDGGGGASFGGRGRDSSVAAGVTYGEIKDPIGLEDGNHLGSGGGSGYSGAYGGGSGGGAIKLTVNGTLQVDGRLQANGSNGYGAGAGSGGSLLLNVGTLSGSGYITAYGGYGNRPNCCNASGGGGGGGRIAIYYANSITDFTNIGVLSAAGGGSVDYGTAGAGTIFIKNPLQVQGELWVQNDNAAGIETILDKPYTFDNVKVWNQGIIASLAQKTLDLTVLGNCTIQNGGYILADGRGYPGSTGTGKGSNNNNGGDGGGGGGYGGAGKSSSVPGGGTYGFDTLPTDFGSGGGGGYSGAYGGGSGGGAIKLTVNGTLQVDGRLQANGSNGYGAGAGSGGSLLLNVGTLSGSGYITAYGGYGNRPNCCNASGGGGGGGRIAIYYANSITDFTNIGVLSAAGGGSVDYGTAANGTIYELQTSGYFTVSIGVNPTTLAGGQQAAGSVTLSAPAPSGGLNLTLTSSNSAVTVPSSVTIAEGATSATFPVTASSVSRTATATVSAQLWDQLSSVPVTVTPWLSLLKVTPGSVAGGATVNGTLTLNVAAPSSGLTVSLASSDPSVTFPNGNSVTVAGGTNAVVFPLAVGSVTAAKSVTITASYLAENLTTSLYINPSSVQVKTIAVTPGSVVGGAIATGVVTLTKAAPSGGAIVALASSDGLTAPVPVSVTVPAGLTSAPFTIHTSAVTTTKSVLLNATLGTTVVTTLTVRLPGVSSLALLPNSVAGGDTSVGVVTLDAVPTFPITVTVTSDQAAAVPAATLVIAAGQTTGTFNIATSAVSVLTTATITAKANNISKSQPLVINPPVGVSGMVVLDGAVDSAQPVTFEFRPTTGASFTRQITLNADGSFQLTQIPAKTYTVRVKGAKWTANTVAVDASKGSVTSFTATLLAGDATNDNLINFDDFLVLLNSFGSSQSDPLSGYDTTADFNCDGLVNFDDFLLLLNNFGTAGDN